MVDHGQDRISRDRIHTGPGVSLYRIPLRPRNEPGATAAERPRRGTYDQSIPAAHADGCRQRDAAGNRPLSRALCRRGDNHKIAVATGWYPKWNGRLLLCGVLASGGTEQFGSRTRYSGEPGCTRPPQRELSGRDAVFVDLPSADRWRRNRHGSDADIYSGGLLGGRGVVFRECFPGGSSRSAILADTT